MEFLSIRADAARVLDEAPRAIADDELLWCDCHHEQARDWVETIARLTGVSVFEDHLLDAENPYHPSFFDSTRSYEMIVFRGLAFNAATSDEGSPIRIRTRPTVFFVFPRCLVTIRAADSRLVPALRIRLLAAAQANQRLPASAEELMLRMLNGMVDRYLELRQPLTDQLERWQRQLLDPRRPFRDWLMLLEARGELRKLEQLCEEQLDALQEWRDERLERADPSPGRGIAPLNDPLQVRASDVVEHIHRVLSHARRMQDAVETAVQLHFSATAHRTNDIMRTLTTITAIFMPLSLITGIFGMNFEFIPGLHARLGFWIAIGVMAAVGLGLLGYFRARRYLTEPGGSRRGRRRRPPPSEPLPAPAPAEQAARPSGR
jgi:Mg2+ and Co2+ transporter CorA